MEMPSTGPRQQPAAPQTSAALIVAELKSNPKLFAKRLYERHLFIAKRLGRVLDVHKTAALELLAKAGGAESYYYMRKLILEALTSEVGAATVNKLRPYHPLLLGGTKYHAPNYEAILATKEFATLLAKEAGTTSAKILHQVFAPLWQAETWNELTARHIKDVLEPLYRFVVPSSGEESGRFEWSEECHSLSRELRYQEQVWNTRYERHGIEAEYEKAEEAIRRMAAEHPSFLEAGLVLARITLEEESPERAVEILGDYIERAEARIPPDYSGYIESKHPENGPYLWLLRTAVEAHFESGATASAAHFEAKLRRIHGPAENPTSNLALLLLASGETRKAMEDLASIDSIPDGYAAATRAFVYFGAKRLEAFHNQFVHALFTMPWLRKLVTEYDMQPEWDERSGPIPRRFADLAESALYRTLGLREACLKLLDDNEIQEAEQHLEELWAGSGADGDPAGARAAWREALMAEVQSLAPWDASLGRVESIGTRLAGARARGLVVKETFSQSDLGPGLRRWV